MAVVSSFSRRCVAALATAAAVLPQAHGTSVIVDSTQWTLIENRQCGLATIVSPDGDEAMQFSTEAEAKAACEDLKFECYGIYDMSCAGNTYFLCSANIITSADDLDFSDTSCVQELTIITGTATTTTVATTEAPAATPGPVAATTAAAPAATTVTVQPDACNQLCTVLDGDSALTCREQILNFKPPTEDTGSMPTLEMTCENKRALVSSEGTCQECSGCDVCETTLADTRLWKISDNTETFEATGTRWGAGPLVAGLATFAGALLVAVSVVVRRRFGWEHLREQPEDA